MRDSVISVACGNRATGRVLLPPPAQGPVKESAYKPEKPYEVRAEGSMTRTVYQTEATLWQVEIRDVIAPAGKTMSLQEAGALVMEVRSGSAKITQGGKVGDLGQGGVVALSQGERAQMENNGPEPLTLRLYLLRGR
jgi:mannose-6-phosphate isomerase-like protein (cupin superfamily)